MSRTNNKIKIDPLRELKDIKRALDESAIVAITDQKGRITYANKKFCEISKYSQKELLGHDHRIVNSGYHSKEFIRNLWRTIAQGKVWRGEIRNKAKDGSFYWVDTTIVPFLTSDKKPYQYVAIRYDITHLKEMEDEIARLPQRIIDVQEQERKYISREIHDDLGQSLAVLKILIQSANAVGGYNKNSADPATAASQQNILRMLDKIMSKTRKLSAGLRPSTFEVLGLTTAIRNLVEEFSQHHGLKIQLRNCRLDDFEFAGDGINLYRVIQEALTNILKHSRATFVKINFQRRKNKLAVYIEDNGIGFKITKGHQGASAGLGLSTMQERIRILKGTLEIQSQPKLGAMIIIELPVKRKKAS